jgi:antitoxin (DNA-binding transcriptional repressor) of toxin-antitoxin stability system
MKHVTASQARREWFRILDEVAEGEIVIIDRKGRRIQIRRVEATEEGVPIPDYSSVLRVREDVAEAHRWGWEWTGEEDGALRPVEDGEA